MKRVQSIAALLALILTTGLLGCGKKDTSASGTSAPDSPSGQAPNGNTALIPNTQETATPETAPDVPMATEPVEGDASATEAGATSIRLGQSIEVTGKGADAVGATVTVTHAGTYVISGTATDAQLVVDTADAERVTLILNGASLSSSTGPAIFVKSAKKKVVIHTAHGSVNLLADGAGYAVSDEEQIEGELYPNACLYACADIELGGTGELYITGNADKGINTKDDLTLTSGTVVVTSVGVGIRANDNLTVSGSTLTVSSGGDGIKTANIEKAGKGRIAVNGGTLYVTAKGDGLSAATDLSIFDGTLVLTTTDEDGVILPESTGNQTSSDSMGGGRPGGGGFGGGRPGMPGESSSDKAAISAKGIKAAGELHIAGGRITIVAQDDGLHTNGNLTVSGGTLHIRSADDGMHADKELLISGGTTEIAQSYEGLEALHITVSGGTNRITASDDGANASDGSGGGFGGMGGGRPGMWGGSSGSIEFSEDQPCLTFAGGYTVFNAGGDGVDSNGWIKMTGGTVLVYGPTDNGNGPIDTGDGGYTMTVSGGTFLAVGSSGMAESAENGGQAVVAAYWNRTGLSAGEIVGIVDADGHVLAAFELPKSIASLVFSSPEIEAGKTYSLVSGGSFAGEATDGVIDTSTYTGFESMGEIEAY